MKENQAGVTNVAGHQQRWRYYQ